MSMFVIAGLSMYLIKRIESEQRVREQLKEGDVVVMKKLTGIRDRAKHRRSQNGDFHSWAFRKLQFFTEYKALERGYQ